MWWLEVPRSGVHCIATFSVVVSVRDSTGLGGFSGRFFGLSAVLLVLRCCSSLAAWRNLRTVVRFSYAQRFAQTERCSYAGSKVVNFQSTCLPPFFVVGGMHGVDTCGACIEWLCPPTGVMLRPRCERARCGVFVRQKAQRRPRMDANNGSLATRFSCCAACASCNLLLPENGACSTCPLLICVVK